MLLTQHLSRGVQKPHTKLAEKKLRARACNLPYYTLTRHRLFDFLEISLNTQDINNEPLFQCRCISDA
jgi:hypothetical protein